MSTAQTHLHKVELLPKEYKTETKPFWCPGCGDHGVLTSVYRALAERAAHPVFGYTVYPESLYESLMHWLDTRHGWQIERESILFCPGVVPSLHACIMALTQPGDGVIVQSPVYAPFLSAPRPAGANCCSIRSGWKQEDTGSTWTISNAVWKRADAC